MNPRVFSVFLAWMDLHPEEQEQFNGVVRTFEDLSEERQGDFRRGIDETINSVDPGPLKDPCPRCGR